MITDLFTQSLTLLRTTAEARDEIGGSSVDTETSTVVLGYLEPLRGSEDEENRNTQIGDWRAFVPAATDVDGWDRVTYGSRSFDIIAPPRPVWNPRTSEVHHIEFELREVK